MIFHLAKLHGIYEKEAVLSGPRETSESGRCFPYILLILAQGHVSPVVIHPKS